MIPEVRRLIKELCANFGETGSTEVKNWCWPRDKACRFFTGDDPGRCGYFEESVLPTDPGLQAEYSAFYALEEPTDPDMAAPRKQVTENWRRCKCGKTFTRKSNRQVLCDDCSKAQKKKKSRERKQRQRMKDAAC